MTITGSQRIVVSGLGVAPAGAEARIHVAASNAVTFRGLQADGGAGGAGVSMDIAATATGVVVADSTFLHCSSPSLHPYDVADVVIQHNTFDDLDDTDAVHGFGGGVIRANRMDHALPHGGGNHNDFIQIGAGGPWTIDGNWFGVRTGGAPRSGRSDQRRADPRRRIENNVVTGHYSRSVRRHLRGRRRDAGCLLPRNITVINNTVISGLSIRCASDAHMRRCRSNSDRSSSPTLGERLHDMCGRIRSGHNVFGIGQACSATDAIGNPHLDADGAPTAASALLIDRGDASVAPAYDYFGYARTVGTAGHRRDRVRSEGAGGGRAGEAARTGAPAFGARRTRPAQDDRARAGGECRARHRNRSPQGAHRREVRARRPGARHREARADDAATRKARDPHPSARAGRRHGARGHARGTHMTQARLDALVAFGLACVLALWLTPIAARLATRIGLVDHRSSARRLHTSPIPFGGGIAMFVAVAVPVLLLSPSLGGRAHAILLGACVCAAVGLLDDRFEIDPIAKFIGELAAAAIPVAAGATIDHLTLPLLHPLDLGALQYPVTMLWIVALMNSFNFIDGMDGLAAGVGAITASTFAILALSLNRGGAAVLAAALAGACLGFLRYNFHPARVFMGDAGSLTLGYLLAVIAIQGVLKTAAAVALLFPTLVLLVPIFDTSFVLLHRIKYGRRPWSADANHLHHRFVRVGFGQRRAALAIYAWCTLLAGCALALRFLPWHTHGDVNLGATLILAGLGLCALVATVWIVVVLEVVKQRHLQLFGLARHTDVPGDMPVIEAWRRRRAATEVKR